MTAHSQPAWPLADKTVLITGVSSGLGRAMAKTVLARGARVAGTVRNPQDGPGFEALAPDRAVAVTLDITRPDQVAEGVATIIDRFGRIDVLANNAGAGLVGAVEETSDAEALRVVETNFLGGLRMVRAVLPTMRAQGAGRILQFSAIGGFAGVPGLGVYAAAKAATDVLGESLALELAPFGIEVAILTLGVFETEFAGRSLTHTDNRLEAYRDTPSEGLRAMISTLQGKQPNDTDKIAEAVATVLEAETMPLHMPLGADALATIDRKWARLRQDLDTWSDLARSVAKAA